MQNLSVVGFEWVGEYLNSMKISLNDIMNILMKDIFFQKFENLMAKSHDKKEYVIHIKTSIRTEQMLRVKKL